MRPIDANVVVKGLVEIRDNLKEGFPKRFQQETIRKALRVVEESPTVDAVPVVRCKDCRHCEDRRKYLRCVRRGFSAGYEVKPEDFCSYGERD